MSFDLNNPTDFALVTRAAEALGLRDENKWEIEEASFKDVKFHVFTTKQDYEAALPEIIDRGGRRKAKYQFPYVDGQTTADLGRMPNDYSVEAIFYGRRYMVGLRKLLKALDSATPGILIHPVMGRVEVVAETWEITHRHDARKSAALRINFTEHNYSIFKIEKDAERRRGGLKDLLVSAVTAVRRLSEIARVLSNVPGAVRAVANDGRGALLLATQNFNTLIQRINETFNTDWGSIDIPGISPVQQGGTFNDPSTAEFKVGLSLNDPYALQQEQQQPPSTLNPQQAVDETNAVRAQLLETIRKLSAGVDGQGVSTSVVFYEEILEIRKSATTLQLLTEEALKSSNFTTSTYTVPYRMSLRQAAFNVGIPLDNTSELVLLNPELDSVNFIEKGTELEVPVRVV